MEFSSVQLVLLYTVTVEILPVHKDDFPALAVITDLKDIVYIYSCAINTCCRIVCTYILPSRPTSTPVALGI